MLKIGIISALQSELNNIFSEMKDVEEIKYKRFSYKKGKINNVEVIGAVCSIGKVNAASLTQNLLDKFDVDYVLNTGIAGSLSSKCKHFTVVVGDKVFYHDFDNDLFSKYAPFQKFFQTDDFLKSKFLSANNEDENVLVGDVATGDEFVEDRAKKERIKANFAPLCVEMEGGAIGHVCFLNETPFLVLRCISDMADESANFDYNEFETKAANRVADMVIKMLKTL